MSLHNDNLERNGNKEFTLGKAIRGLQDCYDFVNIKKYYDKICQQCCEVFFLNTKKMFPLYYEIKL